MAVRLNFISEEQFKEMETRVGGSLIGRMKSGAVIQRSTVPTGVSDRSPSKPMAFTLTGQVPSGKNQVQMLWRNGKVHRYPNKTFTNWRAQAYIQILEQRPPGVHLVHTKPVRLICTYWPGNLITRDISGQIDAIFSLLVHANVLKDDGLVHEAVWIRGELDRKRPRVEVTVEAL